MTLAEFDAFCATLPHSFMVVQWEGAHVWKLGTAQSNKMFAIGSTWDRPMPAFTFKCSPMSFELLSSEEGCRPAPYMASRGMLWIQRFSDAVIDDLTLTKYLRESHRLCALNLSKRLQKELCLLPA
jgi:predicted DNA-binding protein (MmcQ/YjbR family)